MNIFIPNSFFGSSNGAGRVAVGALMAFVRVLSIEEGAVEWNRGRRNTRRSLLGIRDGKHDTLRCSKGERRQACIVACVGVEGIYLIYFAVGWESTVE